MTTLVMPSQASSDMEGDDWEWDQGASSKPWLALKNDTRTHLHWLIGLKKGIPFDSPVLPAGLESRSWDTHFALKFKGAAAPASTSATSDDQSTENELNSPLMLAMERLDLPPEYLEEHEQKNRDSRFVSNNSDSLTSFLNALLADDGLSMEERQALAVRRIGIYALFGTDAEESMEALPEYQAGSSAALFKNYLQAAEAFYQGDYPDAEQQFSVLSGSAQPWLAETSTYMLFRVALNQSTSNALDEYEWFDIAKVDKEAVLRAQQRIEAYLERYPQGLYADSANNMLRRVYFYLGDQTHLAQQFMQAFARSTDWVNEVKLLQETDYSFDFRQFVTSLNSDTPPQSPEFVLVYGLTTLRYNPTDSILTQEMLQKIRPMFADAGASAMWDYLHNAWLFYKQQDYDAVLAATPPVSTLAADDLIGFSQQVLHGEALLALKKNQEEEQHWLNLLSVAPLGQQKQYMQFKLAALWIGSNQ
ncbi:MAG: hypothetical protein ACRC5A_16815, partial [Enterobacteriaceae bacterium]